jgi:hypothetical protein
MFIVLWHAAAKIEVLAMQRVTRSRRLLRTQPVAILASLLQASAAFGSQLLDQENVVISSIAETPSDAQEIGQTFTVGISGPLAWIEVQLGRFQFTSGNAVLTVYNTLNGLPNAPLGTAEVSSSMIPTSPDFIIFNLQSQGITAEVGDVLAFGIKNLGSGPFILPYENPSSYDGGRGLRRTLSVPPGPWQGFAPGRDFGFRTYVGTPLRFFGDFNSDGSVDAADYVLWRKYRGDVTEAAINNNGNGLNGIDSADYDLWRAHFAPGPALGAGGSMSLSVAVPEATSACLILGIGSFFAALRRAGRWTGRSGADQLRRRCVSSSSNESAPLMTARFALND